MLPLALLAAATAATAGVVMSQPKPGTVYPFAPTKPSAADTIVAADTVFADDGWSVVTLNRLSDVEDLLDSLEAHEVCEREVRVMGNNNFRVRWK